MTKRSLNLSGFEDVVSLSPSLSAKTIQILDFLKGISTSDPVYSAKICENFGITPVGLRAVIHYLRTQGHPITSTSRGYAYAHDPDDESLDITIKHLYEREIQIKNVRESLQYARYLMKENS